MTTVIDNRSFLLEGFGITVLLITLSTAQALLGGTLLAAFWVSPVSVLQRVASGYVTVVRNVPAPLVFFVTLFGFPQVGITIPFFSAAVTALSVYYSAFFCDAVRSGINAISPGQFEASRAIGLTFSKSLRFIVLPQAFRNAIPLFLNCFIALTKSSAIASAFGVAELLTRAEGLVAEESPDVLWVLGVTSLLYLALTIPASTLAARVENKVAVVR